MKPLRVRVMRNSSILIIAVSCLLTWTAGTVANAANHSIPVGTASFDGAMVKPGDTVVLAAGSRGPLKISNLAGSLSSPIIVRNDTTASGPVVIRRTAGSAGGYVFECRNCVNVVFDGSAGWSGAPVGTCSGISAATWPAIQPPGARCGIKVTMTGGESPSAFFKMLGTSRNFTIRGVEVDGVWPSIAINGTGIDVNDHEVSAAQTGLWRENILIEDCYIHDVQGEGMYVGPNWLAGANDTTDVLRLRNIKIQYNATENTGNSGIAVKSAIQGPNLIYRNIIQGAGMSSAAGGGAAHALAVTEGGSGMSIIGNKVFDAREGQPGSGSGNAIHAYTQLAPLDKEPFKILIANNVVGDARKHGIVVGSNAGAARYVPTIQFNTIVNVADTAVSINANTAIGGNISDNILAGSGAKLVASSTSISKAANSIGDVASQGFVNPAARDFRLTASSSNKDTASTASISDDYNGVSRPFGGAPDRGAYEFVSETSIAGPSPPSLQVQ